MNILLRTNTNDPYFELSECHALGNTDFESFLIVRSGPFQAQISFWFDRFSLEETLKCLSQMKNSLSGECKLYCQFEKPFIQFRGDGRGHIIVSGLLIQTGPFFQRLEFELCTDQTCLPELISDLEALAGEPVLPHPSQAKP